MAGGRAAEEEDDRGICMYWMKNWGGNKQKEMDLMDIYINDEIRKNKIGKKLNIGILFGYSYAYAYYCYIVIVVLPSCWTSIIPPCLSLLYI